MMAEIELRAERIATGGAAIGRATDGRIVFIDGALPGDLVKAAITAEHRNRLEARTVAVLEPGPGRRTVGCSMVERGCGGCDWQHAEPQHQRELRRAVVIDCLERLGRISEPSVMLGPDLGSVDYRTTVRAAVVAGRAGYRARRSHDVVVPEACPVAHPGVEEILVEGRFGEAREVTVRVGARTGERLVLAEPTAEGVVVPDDVVVVGADQVSAGSEACFHERIGGVTLRVSASSFFQCRPDGAEALVELAAAGLGDVDGPLLDAYAGVGLFGALLGQGRSVTAVESSRSSVADADHNLRAAGVEGATVIRSKVERWRPAPMGAVVADPARAGLGRIAVERLVATEARRLVLISCDPASLARDAALLIDRGYDLRRVTTVDLFAQTSHVETVSVFERT